MAGNAEATKVSQAVRVPVAAASEMNSPQAWQSSLDLLRRWILGQSRRP